jgi:hypothetical protein
MELNQIPAYDETDNPTGCCPRFHPEGWDEQELRFDDKPFVRASTVSAFHVPLNMGSVFHKTEEAIRRQHAEAGSFLVLSHDTSAWHADHLFAVDKDVAGADMVRLSGTFLTKVLEGPYSDAKRWCGEMERYVAEKGKRLEQLYFFYTTCPRCAKAYGKNYVVGVAKVS